VYNLLKKREFVHTPMYNPALLQAIGMDVRFTTIWKAIGWKKLIPFGKMVLTS
jgi:hypothetical protein